MMKLECDQRLPTLNEYIKAVNGAVGQAHP